jgi:hypothetical protein
VNRAVTFERLCTAVLFLVIALVGCLMPAQTDTWWQLRTGEEIWLKRAVDLHDHFSHTVNGSYWPNHEWLSQTLFYAVYKTGGLALLTAFCAAAVVGAWALAWRLTPDHTRRHLLIAALAIIPSSTGWTVRPQVLTLLCFAATMFLVIRRRELFLPPLFLVWANLHGGVVLGFLCIGGATVDVVLRERRFPRRLLIVAGGCVMATMLTPLGRSFWAEIPASVARLHEYRVLEWQSPRLTDLYFMPFWWLALALVALAIRFQPWRPYTSDSNALIWTALAMLPMSLSSARNIPLFLLAAIPAITDMWAKTYPQPHRWERPRRHERYAFNFAAMSATAVMAALAVAYAWSVPIPRLGWKPLPADAIAALNSCPERLYNRYDEGGFLIWFVRGRKVFLDSRQDPFPSELVLAHIRADETGEYEDLFSRFSIRCAFIPAGSPMARRLTADGWRHRYEGLGFIVLARDGSASNQPAAALQGIPLPRYAASGSRP